MGDATHETQGVDYIVVQAVQSLRFGGIAREGARGEDAAVVGGVERRGAVSVSFGENNLALRHDAVDMKNITGNKLLEQIIRLRVAELIEKGPQFVWRLDLFHTDARSLRAGLQKPRRFDA